MFLLVVAWYIIRMENELRALVIGYRVGPEEFYDKTLANRVALNTIRFFADDALVWMSDALLVSHCICNQP